MYGPNTETLYKKYTLPLTEIRNLSGDNYVLRLGARPFRFTPGQYILLGFPGEPEKREYSIYSAAEENYLEVLIREVTSGDLSRRFRTVHPDDMLEIEGPFGFFTLDQDAIEREKFLFIASGTGISPFHSMVRSYPILDYKLLHGIRTNNDSCEREEYEPGRLITCTSRESNGDFHGRVTAWLEHNEVERGTKVYLCGNSEMIHDAIEILTGKGHSLGQMHSEVYF